MPEEDEFFFLVTLVSATRGIPPYDNWQKYAHIYIIDFLWKKLTMVVKDKTITIDKYSSRFFLFEWPLRIYSASASTSTGLVSMFQCTFFHLNAFSFCSSTSCANTRNKRVSKFQFSIDMCLTKKSVMHPGYNMAISGVFVMSAWFLFNAVQLAWSLYVAETFAEFYIFL